MKAKFLDAWLLLFAVGCTLCDADQAPLHKIEKPEHDRPRLIRGGDAIQPVASHEKKQPIVNETVVANKAQPLQQIRKAAASAIHEVNTFARKSNSRTSYVYKFVGDPADKDLGPCEADCDSDSHCIDGLVCMQRKKDEPVPGCRGNPKDGDDYCYDPRFVIRGTNPVFETIGDNGKPLEGNVWPADGLGPCQADCDTDGDCQEGLMCKQRTGMEAVQGCSGVPVDGDDYCYDPNTMMPSSAPSSAPSARVPTVSPVPTSSPTEKPTKMPTGSPTMSPTRTGLFVLDDSRKPFNKCEGNCKSDDECIGELRCQKRGAYEFVPGCDGEGRVGVNYCYNVQDGIAPPPLPSTPFRLRLFWEKGYFWQETKAEAKWCLSSNSPPSLRSCGSGSKFEIVYVQGPGDQIKLRDRDRCLERTRSNAVSFRPCDKNNEDQRFLANWSSRRFDIRPANKPSHCLTNHHHPRPGEVITSYDCNLAHMTHILLLQTLERVNLESHSSL